MQFTQEQKNSIITKYCRDRWALEKLEKSPKALFRSTRISWLQASIELAEIKVPRCRFIYAACYMAEAACRVS